MSEKIFFFEIGFLKNEKNLNFYVFDSIFTLNKFNDLIVSTFPTVVFKNPIRIAFEM